MNSITRNVFSVFLKTHCTKRLLSQVTAISARGSASGGPIGVMIPPPSVVPPPLISPSLPTAIRDMKLPTTVNSNKISILDPGRNSLIQNIVLPNVQTGIVITPLIAPPTESANTVIQATGLKRLRIYRMYRPKNMLRIRSEKMNKHKLKKWRKKYAALIKKVRMRRDIKKEKLFRAELLAQIKEAETFNAEKYVKYVLDTIDRVPQRETLWERRERHIELMRKYKSNTKTIPPKFEDPVP